MSKNESTDEKDPHDRMAEEENEKIRALFEKLDVNNDGRICIHDLTKAFKELNVQEDAPVVSSNTDRGEEGYGAMATSFLQQSDMNKDGHVDFHEFVKYFKMKNKKLKIAFEKMDVNDDGILDAKEIQEAFSEMGVNIDMDEANNLLKSVDKDKTLKIDFDEWSDYFFFHPTGELKDMVRVWRQAESLLELATCVESGGVVTDGISDSTEHGMVRLKHMLAGALAGFMSRTLTAPLDRLKVLRQVYGYKHTDMKFWNSFAWMVKEGGVTSMWRGNGINVLKVVPEMAMRFGAFEAYKRFFHRNTSSPEGQPPSFGIRFLSGALAGATAQSAIYPLEVVKTRMCLRKTGQFSSIGGCIKNMWSERGVRAFYRGYVVNIVGVFPYAGIELSCYETLRNKFGAHFKGAAEGKPPPAPLVLGIASVSTFSGVVVCYPLSLVRTKLQSKSHFDSEVHTNSASGLIKCIWKEEGIRGFYRGVAACLCKVIPAVAISYYAYEKSCEKLGVASFSGKTPPKSNDKR